MATGQVLVLRSIVSIGNKISIIRYPVAIAKESYRRDSKIQNTSFVMTWNPKFSLKTRAKTQKPKTLRFRTIRFLPKT
jgi:hypothetical protein